MASARGARRARSPRARARCSRRTSPGSRAESRLPRPRRPVRARDAHEIRVTHLGTAQQLGRSRFARWRAAEQHLRLRVAQRAGAYPRLAEARLLARDRLAFGFEPRVADIVDEPEAPSDRGEAQVGVVLAQQETVLGTRGEHAIRLRHPARDEIVDEHAEIGLVAPRPPRLMVAQRARGVHARDQSLRRRFLVAGRAVDLSGEVEPGDRLRLERGLERARIEVVVLDGVAGPRNHGTLEAPDRAHELPLHVEGQAGRDAVRVHLDSVEPLGLDEDLVALAIGEAHHLVLDRRTIARPHALDHARVHGRAIERAANELVRASVRIGDVARHLRGCSVRVPTNENTGTGSSPGCTVIAW